MKVRSGFVSNSSSSSFLAIVPKDDFNKLPFTAIELIVIDCMEVTELSFNGSECVKIYYSEGEYGSLHTHKLKDVDVVKKAKDICKKQKISSGLAESFDVYKTDPEFIWDDFSEAVYSVSDKIEKSKNKIIDTRDF
jgi:hypothetical protein